MTTSDLTDDQWEKLRPLLPPQKPRTGRPAHDHRTVLDGILWVLRTGSPWRSLPGRYGSWKTVSSRFYRWQRDGVWDRDLSALQRQADGGAADRGRTPRAAGAAAADGARGGQAGGAGPAANTPGRGRRRQGLQQ